MSLLYKDEKDVKYSVEVKTTIDGKINLLFSADCGKFGTDEILDEHDLTVKQLLEILQANDVGQSELLKDKESLNFDDWQKNNCY